MRVGPFEITRNKTYAELDKFMAMEKRALIGDPKTNPIRQLSEYKSWVYSATSLISRGVSVVPYKFYRKDTEEEVTGRIHGYDVFTSPFTKPNPLMSFRFIKAWCQLQWDLCGMMAIYKARNMLGEPRELWPLNMNDFQGVYDSAGRPIEYNSDILPSELWYVFYINGKKYGFRQDELILNIHPHPKSPHIGASPIQAQAYITDIQTYIEVYERDFFANSARVDMVLATDDELDGAKAADIKERWLDKFRGRYHDVAVLDKGLKPVPMKYTNVDFQFLELAKWSRDMVFAAYGINPAKVGLSEDVNRSNSVYVDIGFNRDVIQPRLTCWDEECTKEVLEFFNPKIKMVHDNPVPRDRQIETSEARVYLGGAPFAKINEFRKKQGLKPDSDGETILVPTKFIPLDMLKDYWKAQIKALKTSSQSGSSTNGGDSKTDPTRHDGDTPHLNPDGSDNRDENPTENRNFEQYMRKAWYDQIKNYLLKYKNFFEFESFFYKLMLGTIGTYLDVLKRNDFFEISKNEKWVKDHSNKISSEFKKTISIKLDIDNWEDYIKQQMDTNERIAKICNSAIRSCINYTRFLLLDTFDIEKTWEITGNVCGHRGRLKNFSSKNYFVVGDTEMRFPNEILNLNCDCILSFTPKLLGRFVKDDKN